MAIDPSRSVPDDVATVSSLQSTTEESAKAAMRAPIDQSWGSARGSFVGNIIGGIANSLAGIAQGGIFSGVDAASKQIRDGQEDLTGRTDLLSPLLDYGSVSMPSGQPSRGTGFLPFNRQIGPMRNVSVKQGNSNNAFGLEFHDKGLWDVRLHATASWIFGATGLVEVHLNVYRPDGSRYSSQRSVLVGMRYGLADGDGEQTHTINSSVIVPEPGYYALVWVQRCAPLRYWLGGPAWSRLTAQHITREVDGNWGTGAENSDANEEGN